MKTLFSVMREPVMIGAFVLALLIVIASYVGSHYYYGETTIIETPVITPSISQPSTYTPAELDLGELQDTDTAETETSQDAAQVEELLVEDFLAELSDEEKALLTADVADEIPRESPHGFGALPRYSIRLPTPEPMGRIRTIGWSSWQGIRTFKYRP